MSIVTVAADELAPGVVLASGHIVETVDLIEGVSIRATFTNGSQGMVGRKNRILIEGGTL